MEVDETLAERMQRIAQREREIAAERQALQTVARNEFASLDARIEEVRNQLMSLENRREELARFIGIPASMEQVRLGHGALKELCFKALEGHEEGLRSAEVKSWIEQHHPSTRTASVPATLSRQVEFGNLLRDDLGRYRIKKKRSNYYAA